MALALRSVEAAASAIKLALSSGRLRARALRHYERLWRAPMPDVEALILFRDAMAGPHGLDWIDACSTELERLALVAPLVGPPQRVSLAIELLDRLRGQRHRNPG